MTIVVVVVVTRIDGRRRRRWRPRRRRPIAPRSARNRARPSLEGSKNGRATHAGPAEHSPGPPAGTGVSTAAERARVGPACRSLPSGPRPPRPPPAHPPALPAAPAAPTAAPAAPAVIPGLPATRPVPGAMSSVINVRLNEKMTLKFVELYRDQRLLWDKEHEGYNKRTDRLRAYRRIVDGMAVQGLGVPEVASKIKNIRSTYLQELKKMKDSAQRLARSDDGGGGGGGDGSPSAPPYVPKLLWFPIMDAMIGGRPVKHLYSSPSTAEYLSIDYAEGDCSNHSHPDDKSGCDANTRLFPDDHNPAVKMVKYERREQASTQSAATELFSRFIATSLDSLPPRLAILAQKDLHDVLVKYKQMEFDGQDR